MTAMAKTSIVAGRSNAAEKLRQILQSFMQIDRDIQLESMLVFFAVCESEGLTVKSLVHTSGLGESMVSRRLSDLCSQERGQLLLMAQHPTDQRRRLVFLSQNGRKVLAQIEEAIAETSETES